MPISKDNFSCEIFDGTNHDDRYKVLGGIIYYKYRIYLVPNSSLKEKNLKKTHDSPLAGHTGFFKTYRMLREIFAWKGLKADVLKYVNEYPTCQQKEWIKWLHLCEFCYNTTFHMSIGMSHFKEIYGYDAYKFIDHIFGDSRPQNLRI